MQGSAVGARHSSSSAPGRSRSSVLSQSYDSFTNASEVDGKDSSSSSDDELTTVEVERHHRHRNVPRRPRTAPRKGHIHRGVLGLSHNMEASSSKREIFMTHLPDSPPRSYTSSPSVERMAIQRSPHTIKVIQQDHISANSIFKFSTNERSADKREISPVALACPLSTDEGLESKEEQVEVDSTMDEEEEEASTFLDTPTELGYDEVMSEETSAPDALVSSDEETVPSTFDEELMAIQGPSATEILSIPVIESATDPLQADNEEERPEFDSDEQEYQALQTARRQFEEQEARREQARRELESYVSSLTTRHDENGEKWFEFPKNYQQIVSLMTERDVREEQEEKTKCIDKKQKSWSQILIQNSLSKQQAYGALEEGDEGTDGDKGLTAKIALKMARIRQLDAVLEEKLGKNLYATNVTKKSKPQSAKSSLNSESRTKSESAPPSTQRSGAVSLTVGGSGTVNYVERNRKVVENGAKANMTRDEEVRLSRLLQVDTSLLMIEEQQPQPQDGSVEMAPVAPREFVLEEKEKQEIEQLLAHAAFSVRPSLTDIQEEEETNDRVEDSVSVNNKEKHKPRKTVTTTFNERVNKRRLQQIDEELQFLREHEDVPILPDDEDTQSDDGCRTERSYMTTTSMGSTCSTRSGVTRRQLDLFMAMEVKKPECRNGSERASTDAIQSLLRSLSHVSMSRLTTTV